ncbi:MAG: Hsp33 family molecular chaperone HslO [Neisseriaceae bacterium]|nr:Hsp33 family molecular chaperone HslO [Neisseriaceae bacterium]
MNNSNITDFRKRFIFNNLPVRGVYVNLSETFQHIISLKDYPKNIQDLLAQLLAASVLLSSTIKFNGQLILQIQGKGDLKLLVAESTSYQTCRATAEFNQMTEIDDNISLQDLLGDDAIFVATVQPENGEMWQGIVPLEGSDIAQILMNYMRQSEQLDTFFKFSTTDNEIHGLLLQKLPSDNNEKIHKRGVRLNY